MENTSTNTNNPLTTLKNYVGEGGLLPFEHGFKKPRFNYEGYTYVVSMISDKVVYCKKIIPFGQNRNANLYLKDLPPKTINRLYKFCLKYEDYCKNEA